MTTSAFGIVDLVGTVVVYPPVLHQRQLWLLRRWVPVTNVG